MKMANTAKFMMGVSSLFVFDTANHCLSKKYHHQPETEHSIAKIGTPFSVTIKSTSRPSMSLKYYNSSSHALVSSSRSWYCKIC
jgi:hypothetical protein